MGHDYDLLFHACISQLYVERLTADAFQLHAFSHQCNVTKDVEYSIVKLTEFTCLAFLLHSMH